MRTQAVKMVREYKKKTDREFPEGDLRRAVEDVLNNIGSLRKVSERYNVTKSRLAIYVKRAREQGIENISLKPNFKHRQIFSPEMEQALAEYLLKCSSMFYGLTPKKTRQLAFQFASRNKLLIPDSWATQAMAGEEWFAGFLRRNPELSIRKPEATSLARMTAFNKTVVGEFFGKLKTVYSRHNYEASQIFNLDETGVTTVPPVEKIVGKKREKQIGQVTSRERGEPNPTQVGIICANENALPPVWIFPRIRFDEHRMMSGAMQGSTGLVNKSGWMTRDNFIKVLQFIQRNMRCSKNNPVLLILDNHESHLSDDGITFCKENGIEVLTLPPHTSNKSQPLDRSVFGPFKRYFSEAANSWMMTPNKTLSIYSLAELCSKAWDRAATPENIKSGFRKSGIFPFDRDIFQEHEFLCSSVSDRPAPDVITNQSGGSCIFAETENLDENLIPATDGNRAADETSIPSTSVTGTAKSPLNISNFITPDKISPYPKAEPRKPMRKGRKRGKCMIVTDTPEKEELLERKKPPPKKVKEIKRKVLVESDSSDEEINEELTKDSSSEWEEEEETVQDTHDVEKGGFIVVKVPGKTPFPGRNYVARVERKLFDGFQVRFFKRMIPSNRFKITEEESSFVTFGEVIAVLPKGIEDRRPRFKDSIYFNADLTEFSLT
ncbi:uncharacterized protein LOC126738716 [Anthonomus grandis grandis]|uniref:uncharacterized protein LOC126738716 n=1 Tax=Anthonomus grandis grandis TaxID=2921223 RepID=UPI0021668F2D|nr:uncharacterized protein LOC126738716 [Anthonomus grandis grandis]